MKELNEKALHAATEEMRKVRDTGLSMYNCAENVVRAYLDSIDAVVVPRDQTLVFELSAVLTDEDRENVRDEALQSRLSEIESRLVKNMAARIVNSHMPLLEERVEKMGTRYVLKITALKP